MAVPPALLRKIIGVAALWVWLTLLLRFYIGAQLALVAGEAAWSGVVDSLGYFTVLTTFGIAWVLIAIALKGVTTKILEFFRHPSVISAFTTAIILVALVYALVLRQLWNPDGLRYWVDISLHYVIPPMFVMIWWLLVPAGSLHWRNLLSWLIYPSGYLAMVYVRGLFTGFYPYPFINVNELGVWRVLLNSLGLLMLFAFIGMGLIGINYCRQLWHIRHP